LTTVASAESAIPVIASHAAELMTAPLPETADGDIAMDWGKLQVAAEDKSIVAIGPGLGTNPETVALARGVVEQFAQPMVIDADGLNALAGAQWSAHGRLRVLTPHPGEMSRLTGKKTSEILADRVGVARGFAMERRVTLVLKGYRTLIAFADGRLWINPTGTPAMAKGGTGDILTGMIAGFLAQFPQEPDNAIAAAVYLHGLAGHLGAAEAGDKSLLATDLLRWIPRALEACAGIPNRV